MSSNRKSNWDIHTQWDIIQEWSTDMCYNMDELQKQHAVWKKPDTKDHMLCDFIYMRHTEQITPWRQNKD